MRVPAEWIDHLPKQDGHYWAYCKYDGDMMPVFVEIEKVDDGDYQAEYTRVYNSAHSLLGIIGVPGLTTAKQFEQVFTHYTPFTSDKPLPPCEK